MRNVCLTLLLFSLFSALLPAEEIELKDGSKVTGKLMSIDGDLFHVRTAYGEIQIPRSDVVTIRFTENRAKGADTSGDSGAPASVEEKLDGSTYSNRTARFEATVPPNWMLAPELRKTKDIVAALKSDDQALFFIVTKEKYSGSLKTYDVFVETQIQSSFQDVQKISEAAARLDERNGTRVVFKAKKDTTALTFLVYILPYNDSMIRLTFFTLQPLFDDAEPIFEKIAKSYHSTSDKPMAWLTSPVSSGAVGY